MKMLSAIVFSTLIASIKGDAQPHAQSRRLPDYTDKDAATPYIQRAPTSRDLAGTEITPDEHQLNYIGGGENWMIKLQPGYRSVDTPLTPMGYA